MHVITRRIVSIGFLVVLLAPPMSTLWPVSRQTIDNRDLEPPELTTDAPFDLDYYLDLIRYVRQDNPMQVILARLGGGLDYWLLDESPDPAEVFMGRHQWLFLQLTVRDGCATDPELVTANLSEFIRLLASEVPDVVFTVAPSKVVIHDDALTNEQWTLTQCVRDKSSVLQQALASEEVSGYVDSWSILRKRKDAGLSPYFRTDSHFDYESSIPWVRELVTSIEPGVWSDSDVTARGPVRFEGNLMALIGLQLPETVEKVEIVRGLTLAHEPNSGYFDVRRYRYQSSVQPLIGGSTLVLKDSFMDLPEPFLAQYFEDITFFDWRNADSVSRFLVEVAHADAVIVETSEEGLLGRFSDRSLIQRYMGTANRD